MKCSTQVEGRPPAAETLIPVEEKPYFTDGTPEADWLTGVCGVRLLAGRMRSAPLENYFDAEFNPEGTWPVIMFCDGAGRFTDSEGTAWTDRRGDFKMEDPDRHSRRLDIALAVDFNHNGMRDIGEPVIRQFSEPWRDCGADGVCGKDGDNVAGDAGDDDYNPFTNAAGAENNGLWEQGEDYDDIGLDGEAGTTQWAKTDGHWNGGYDYGEDNQKFDYNPNVQRWLDNCARRHAQNMPIEDLKRINVWMDSGIRDLANFVVMSDHMLGALKARLAPEGLKSAAYQDFNGLMAPPSEKMSDFRFLKVDYGKLGHNVEVRFGNYHASQDLILGGDGRHVGFASQVVYRVQTIFGFADYHFPNGDYEVLTINYNPANQIQKYAYHSTVLNRRAVYSIALPPGYFSDEASGWVASVDNGLAGDQPKPHTCTRRFPVILLSHGYGQKPEDNALAIPILFGFMAEGKLQKMITLFADGKCDSADRCVDDCRDQFDTETEQTQCVIDRKCADNITECEEGNFYADHVATHANPIDGKNPDGSLQAQNGSAMLELIADVDGIFCTKQEEVVEVDGATLDGLY